VISTLFLFLLYGLFYGLASIMTAKRTPDKEAFKWLRNRNPGWSDAKISHSIARSHVIDEHPDWTDAEIEREIIRYNQGGTS
jgi:hypothetical protein